MKYDDFQYQDIRVNGKTVSKGTRECESRYEAIKPFLERYRYKDRFTVLDFGANYGYFSWRIKEDFPNAEVTMVDSRELLKLLYKINNVPGTHLISKHQHLKDIEDMEHYDLILLFSILHHFENSGDMLDAFIDKADAILCEIDYPDKPNFTGRQEQIHTHIMTKRHTQINKWVPHHRPIYSIIPNEVVFNGVINSGSGLAKTTVERLNKTFKWFGIEMYKGTLNVRIDGEIEFYDFLRVHNYQIIKVYLNGLPTLAIRPINVDCNPKRLELISTIGLREFFTLTDGSEVSISIPENCVRFVK